MIKQALPYLAVLIIMVVGMSQMIYEADKIKQAKYQQDLDQHIRSVTISHSVTCNDDEIPGYCTKEMMYKSEFEKGNN